MRYECLGILSGRFHQETKFSDLIYKLIGYSVCILSASIDSLYREFDLKFVGLRAHIQGITKFKIL